MIRRRHGRHESVLTRSSGGGRRRRGGRLGCCSSGGAWMKSRRDEKPSCSFDRLLPRAFSSDPLGEALLGYWLSKFSAAAKCERHLSLLSFFLLLHAGLLHMTGVEAHGMHAPSILRTPLLSAPYSSLREATDYRYCQMLLLSSPNFRPSS